MAFTVQTNCDNIDWQSVQDILKGVGMGNHLPLVHKKAFENSYKVVFIFNSAELVGFGRMLSDGAYQGGIYDIAVKESYQGHQLGKKIVDSLLEGMDDINIILYASPGKEAFYEKFGFRKSKTAMMRFVHADMMVEKGFTQ